MEVVLAELLEQSDPHPVPLRLFIHRLPYSQQKMTKRPTNRSDALSLSFFGWKWELSIETMQQLSDQLSRWYRQYGVLIPARYRAAASAAVILWEELSKISQEIFTTPFC